MYTKNKYTKGAMAFVEYCKMDTQTKIFVVDLINGSLLLTLTLLYIVYIVINNQRMMLDSYNVHY